MYSKIKIIPILVLILLLFSFQKVNAHSGRTDSSGGHNCRTGSCAGTYHYHNGGSAYTPPAPTYTQPVYVAPVCNKPDLSTIKADIQFNESNCSQEVSISWDKGIGDSQYSIGISKYAGADPGPVADTSARRMTFRNVESGKWYINLKGGNSCGWSNVQYWDVDVPDISMEIYRFSREDVGNGTYKLNFDAKCGEQYSIYPTVGTLSSQEKSQGFVEVTPKVDTEYTLTISGNGHDLRRRVSVVVPTIEEDNEELPMVEDLTEDE